MGVFHRVYTLKHFYFPSKNGFGVRYRASSGDHLPQKQYGAPLTVSMRLICYSYVVLVSKQWRGAGAKLAKELLYVLYGETKEEKKKRTAGPAPRTAVDCAGPPEITNYY